MSIFRSTKVACPACETPVDFDIVQSVNAGRKAAFRDAIIDGSFQQKDCPKCGNRFRLDPEMTYTDLKRKQWIAAYPVAKLVDWKKLEKDARGTFDKAFGKSAPASAQALDEGIKPRVTFGWAALREKLIAEENGLDDTTLELLKVSLMRGLDEAPTDSELELRLVLVENGELALSWLRIVNERTIRSMRMPRSVYDDVAADPKGWAEIRGDLEKGLWVDMQRLIV